jgi:hypothetical protein
VILVLVGFVVGVCVAYSGVGAGALTTPALLFMGFDASIAIGSDLLFSLGTKVSALVANFHRRAVDTRLLLALSGGGVPGAVVGVLLNSWLHGRYEPHYLNHVLRVAVGCALLVSAGVILFRRHNDESAPQERAALPTGWLILVGFFVGLMVSLTSVGSGSLTLPLLLLIVPSMRLRPLVGTDIAFSVLMLVPAILGHWRVGDVDARLSAQLLVGAIPGTFVGAALATRLPGRLFRVFLALVLCACGLVLIF